jgi:hypothetical protein
LPHFSSDKSQKVFKIQKNSPLPIIAIFLLLIALCGIVSADLNQSYVDSIGPIPSVFASPIPGYTGMSGTQTGTINISTWNGNTANFAQYTYIDFKNLKVQGRVPIGTTVLNWPSPSTSVNIYSGATLVGTGILTYSFVSNTTPLLAQYEVSLSSITWLPAISSVGFTSGWQLNILQLQYNPATMGYPDPMWTFGVSSSTTGLGSFAGMIFSTGAIGVGNTLAGDINNNIQNNFLYQFKNTVFVNQNNTTGALTWNIIKVSSVPWSGISVSNVSDGSGVLSATVLDSLNKNGVSYNSPIYMNITDVFTGTQFLNTFFYPTFALYAPITNSSTNTPLSIELSSSSTIPSDVNQLVFNTNFPNSNNIFSNLLYDNNQTQRNPLSFYKKTNGYWYQSDGIGFNINLGSTLPNTFTTTFINAGNYYVTATLSSNLIGGFAANNPLRFYITGTNAGTYAYFTISDSKTGNPISGSILGIFDVPNQKWTNTTLTSGSINLPLNTNYFYAYQGTAPNYQPSAFNTLLIPSGGGNATISIALIPSSLAVTAGNTTISIAVVNGLTNAPVSGATVTVSAANATNYATQSQTTVNGNALFVVPTGNTYTASASATGYQSGSLIAVVGSSPVTQTISLTPLSSVPTIATSTTTYPGQQPSIYPTLNGTVTDQTNPFFGNAIDWLGFMGAKPSEIALVLAFLLILLGGVCGSAASSVGLGYAYQPDPLGALAGALLGFIASVAFGFFPAWLAVAAVIIIAFIVARRAWA